MGPYSLFLPRRITLCLSLELQKDAFPPHSSRVSPTGKCAYVCQPLWNLNTTVEGGKDG